MKIIIVDDEEIAIKSLELKISKCINLSYEIKSFKSPITALEWIENNPVDIAFLDIDMGRLSGIDLAEKIKELQPLVSIVFVTGYSEYAIKAFELKATGYLLKPIDLTALKRELEYIFEHKNKTKRLYVQCFGNFDVFVDSEPIWFPRQKSKELFAYLVDRRGASVSMAEIASILWDDGKYDTSRNNQIHSYLSSLIRTFEKKEQKALLLKPEMLFR